MSPPLVSASAPSSGSRDDCLGSEIIAAILAAFCSAVRVSQVDDAGRPIDILLVSASQPMPGFSALTRSTMIALVPLRAICRNVGRKRCDACTDLVALKLQVVEGRHDVDQRSATPATMPSSTATRGVYGILDAIFFHELRLIGSTWITATPPASFERLGFAIVIGGLVDLTQSARYVR